MGRSVTSRANAARDRAEYLGRVCRLLWPEPALVALERPGRDRFATKSRGAAHPARSGSGGSWELIVVPFGDRPRLLVPTERAAAAAAIQRYGEPGSRMSSLRRRATWLAMASGVGPRLFRDRLRIEAPSRSPTILSYLREALGSDVRLSMHVGGARANRKPVLQLLTPDGEAVGTAKIGIDPLTCRLVRGERDALARLASARLRRLTAPRVLHHGSWNDLEVLVLAPLPVWLRRRPLSTSQLAAAIREVSGIDGLTRERLATAPYWRRLLDRLTSAPDGAEREALESALDMLHEQAGGTTLSYGSWHGDWSPWNMASTARGLLVWDWERFAPGVPLGFDALHHWLQVEVGPRRRDPASAARELIKRAPSRLNPFEVGASEARLTALLYLAELAARYLADRQEEAGSRLGNPGWWLLPAITNELAR
jgi:hypothetical protein